MTYGHKAVVCFLVGAFTGTALGLSGVPLLWGGLFIEAVVAVLTITILEVFYSETN